MRDIAHLLIFDGFFVVIVRRRNDETRALKSTALFSRMRRAPTSAKELFGDVYADGPSRVRPSSSLSSSTVRSFGPFTAWDADELGKMLDIRVIDNVLLEDVNAALVALALD